MEGIFNLSWQTFEQALIILLLLSPVWLPAGLIYAFWTLWNTYLKLREIGKTDFILLEIKLPKEIDKSPAAMELVLSAFYQGDPSANFIDKYWDGKFQPWASLELVSLGGEVHFFIWTPKKNKNVLESRIYAQYSNVEIHEVPDYTQFLEFDHSKIKMWGTEYDFVKPDPYPINTYIDYGLDKNPKEFYKIDPLVSLIEYLGSVAPGDQVWHQILVRKHEKRRGRRGIFKKSDWKEEAKEVVKKLKTDWAPEEEGFSDFKLTESQRNTIKAIERSISKNAYEVGIRSIYFSTPENFDSSNIGGLLGSFLQINSQDLNALKPARTTKVKYPWQDYKGKRVDFKKKRMFEAYKARGYFYPPYTNKWLILNSEELATIYHFPGDVAQTPTFGRIGSKKTEPPTNLPVK